MLAMGQAVQPSANIVQEAVLASLAAVFGWFHGQMHFA